MLFLLYVIVAIIVIYPLYTMVNPKRVVLVSTRSKEVFPVLDEILKGYSDQIKDMTFLEIGAGYAHVSGYVAKRNSFRNIVAVELDVFVFLFTKALLWLRKSPIRYIRKNVLKYDISKQTFVYSYMSVYIIDRLYTARQFEDCILVSLSFPITGVVPTKVYDVGGFQKKLYVYDFRTEIV